MRYGIKSVSMDDVAAKLGMSKKTLYQMVDGKRDLVRRIVQFQCGLDKAQVAQSHAEAADALDEYLRNSQFFVSQMRQISPTTFYDLRKYFNDIWEEEMKCQIDYFIESLAANIQWGQAEGLYRPDIDPEVIARIQTQTTIAICDASIFPNGDTASILEQHDAFFLYGLLTAAGHARLAELQLPSEEPDTTPPKND